MNMERTNKMSVFEELKAREMIAQLTHEDKIKDLLENEKVTFYIGFDPTADSLHVGHFLQMMVMAHMQRAGHRPIAIIGGGTAMVGDPSGRSDMRQMLTLEQISHNAGRFKIQMEKIIDFSDGRALMINNGDWLLKLNYVDFLREIGIHFSVNRMLSFECFKSRLENGLSFIEFNYMLMQSYDFLKLYQDFDCILELGGDDQWANIIAGIELTRRVEGKEVYGMTFTLLTNSEGKKMGKTQNGAVWLDPEKTTPYEFYQYWRNVDDADVIKCLKLLTFFPVSEINELAKLKDNEINKAKEILAFEVTKLVHSEEEAQKAQNTAKALFAGNADTANMPVAEISNDDFIDNAINILDLLVKTKIAPSKGEARRLIDQGGIFVNDEKAENVQLNISKAVFDNLIIKKGKKVFIKVVIN
jgi:tyrosyl-tRNA synthetase